MVRTRRERRRREKKNPSAGQPTTEFVVMNGAIDSGQRPLTDGRTTSQSVTSPSTQTHIPDIGQKALLLFVCLLLPFGFFLLFLLGIPRPCLVVVRHRPDWWLLKKSSCRESVTVAAAAAVESYWFLEIPRSVWRLRVSSPVVDCLLLLLAGVE